MSEEIRWISLKNNGAFVVSIRVKGGSSSYNGSSFPVGQERVVDLADAVGKIKDGDVVYLEAVVKAGKNKTAKERFVYRKNSNKKACYSIKGTTLSNSLSYSGIVEMYTKVAEPIRWISLKNNGAFTVGIRVKGDTISSYNTGTFPVGQEKTVDLAESISNLKDGDEIWLEAVVTAGTNNTAKQHFVYRKSSTKKASYTIKGTTLNNTLTYDGISAMYTLVSEPIRAISLKNDGAFTVSIRVKGDSASYNNSSFPVGQERTVDLAEAVGTIKDGDEVWLEAVVAAGTNNVAKQHFIYRKSSTKQANYSIKGTTLNNSLTYNGISVMYTMISEPIRWIYLENNGAFVVSIRVKGGSSSYNTGSFPVGQDKYVDLADAVGKIKDGDEVWLEAVVTAGTNNMAKQHFIYRKTSDLQACYAIKGTTLNNSMTYNGLAKIAIAPAKQATRTEIEKKISDWSKKTASSAWSLIPKKNVVDGLNYIVDQYFGKTAKYTKYRECDGTKNVVATANDNSVRWITLKNNGGFVAKIRVKGGSASYNGSNITLGSQKTVDLADVAGKINEGDTVYLEVVVVGGKNKTAKERFIYKKNSNKEACYTIKGTTLSNTLKYDGCINRSSSSDNVYTGIDQGTKYPICGPVAAMFHVAHLNIATFVDYITTLYESGRLVNYNVPSSLRSSKKNSDIRSLYPCFPEEVADVCWIFQASLAQKESVSNITLSPSSVKMHTRLEEMVDDIDFMFHAKNLVKQTLTKWASVNSALNNLDEWTKCLKKSGAVIWFMHGDALKNVRDGSNNVYTHVDLDDLHWVVVLEAKKTSKNVTVALHSWGKLYRITVTHDEFQKMSYGALLFESP